MSCGETEGLFTRNHRSFQPFQWVLKRRLFIILMEITWTCAASWKFTPFRDYQRVEKPIVRQLRFLMIRLRWKSRQLSWNFPGFLFLLWETFSKHIFAILLPSHFMPSVSVFHSLPASSHSIRVFLFYLLNFRFVFMKKSSKRKSRKTSGCLMRFLCLPSLSSLKLVFSVSKCEKQSGIKLMPRSRLPGEA